MLKKKFKDLIKPATSAEMIHQSLELPFRVFPVENQLQKSVR